MGKALPKASFRAMAARAAPELLGGAQGLKERELQGHLRIYGFEGEAGREGEGRTRIRESSVVAGYYLGNRDKAPPLYVRFTSRRPTPC